MPITVVCGCGARFRTRDEFAGRGKCPKCGQALTIGPAETSPEQAHDVGDEPPPAPAARPHAAAPARASSAGKPAAGLPPGYKRRPKQEAQVRFAISPKVMMFIGVCIAIPTVIWIVKAGPVRARDQWQVLEPQAQKDIEDIINKALSDHAEAAWKGVVASLGVPQGGSMAAVRPKYVPTVNTLLIDSPTIMWSVPAKVSFQGRISRLMVVGISASGKPQLMDLRGVYYTKARRVEAEAEMDGTPVQVRGHVVNGAVVME